jgi:hypothetical protein
MTDIPAKIILIPQGEYKPGVAVLLRFKMKRKNDFTFIHFLNGRKELNHDEMIKEINQTVGFFPMDYVKPPHGFTGEIIAQIMNTSEIERAIQAYETFKNYWDYPLDYVTNLTQALISNAESNCTIVVKQVRGASPSPH